MCAPNLLVATGDPAGIILHNSWKADTRKETSLRLGSGETLPFFFCQLKRKLERTLHQKLANSEFTSHFYETLQRKKKDVSELSLHLGQRRTNI